MRARVNLLRPLALTALAGVLAGALACGGGSSSPTSSAPSVGQSLVYSNPSGTAGYRLVRDAASTPTHLILGVVGPSGTQIQGIVASFSADTSRAVWSSPGGTDPHMAAGSTLSLGSGTPLLKSTLTGAALEAAVFQKGAVAPATLGSGPVFSVALDLVAGAPAGKVGLASPSAQILDATGTTRTITLALGTLSAE